MRRSKPYNESAAREKVERLLGELRGNPVNLRPRAARQTAAPYVQHRRAATLWGGASKVRELIRLAIIEACRGRDITEISRTADVPEATIKKVLRRGKLSRNLAFQLTGPLGISIDRVLPLHLTLSESVYWQGIMEKSKSGVLAAEGPAKIDPTIVLELFIRFQALRELDLR